MGMTGLGRAARGMARRGKARLAGIGATWRGSASRRRVRRGSVGQGWHGQAHLGRSLGRQCWIRHGWRGRAWSGRAWLDGASPSKAWRGWQVRAVLGVLDRGMARPGWAGRGKAARGWQGSARLGVTWHGSAQRGSARLAGHGMTVRRHGKAVLGVAGLAWTVKAALVSAGQGATEQGWHCWSGRASARHDPTGQSLGMARRGWQ
jgi:hypothetical protein